MSPPPPPIDAGRTIATSTHSGISEARAAELAASLFGVHGRAERLDGEYDENFRITPSHASNGAAAYVLKIAPAGDDEALIDLQHGAIRHVSHNEPRLARAELDGVGRCVRLLEFIP